MEKRPMENGMKISRNAPCPCGSGKKYKKCCLSKGEQIERSWIDDEGIHVITQGEMPAQSEASLSETYQENIKNSSMWVQMVKKFGREEAEILLKQCRVESR